LGPLSFSPGETLNLGVQYGNVLTETLQDAVVLANRWTTPLTKLQMGEQQFRI
jgi:hypothetical protein